MKRNIKMITMLVLFWIGAGSCKKSFLEIVPKKQLLASSLRDYDGLMNNTSFYSTYYGLPGVAMGDEVAAESGYFLNASILTQRGFAWQDNLFDTQVSSALLDTELKNLYTCNIIINEVLQAKDGSDLQKRSLRAEALATRAWTYFGMMNYFAKPYNAATAQSDPGFPIILEADLSLTNFTRSSVAEVYQFMITDLETAIPDLPLNAAFKTRMTRQAAKGMLGKIYLFMGKYAEALDQFNSAILDNANANAPAALYNYNVAFQEPSGEFLPIGRFGPNYPGNNLYMQQESVLLKSTVISGDFSNAGIVMSKATIALYQPGDLRLNLYANRRDNFTPLPPGLFGKYAATSVHTGIELADLLLMRAEARARTNDLPGAVMDLESLRANRMPEQESKVPVDVKAASLVLLKTILEERIREFAGEGHRWLDMRRLSVDPLFDNPSPTHVVYGPDGETIVATYKLKPERLTLKFPQLMLAGNPEFENNL